MPESIWQTGELRLSSTGYLLLQVPNALVHGQFATISEPGIELPPSPSGKFDAHITVMAPHEVTLVGPEKITERGKRFRYRLGRLYQETVDNRHSFLQSWRDVTKVYAISVTSPELLRLRRTYGLSDPKVPFHVTVAVRKRNVLRDNPTAKAACWDAVGAAACWALQQKQAVAPVGRIRQQLRAAVRQVRRPASPAQADAGNYRHGHLSMRGMRISIETPAGKRRKPEWPPLKHHYGYITRVYDPKQKQMVTVGEAADGDHVDCFIGTNHASEYVFVVDQVDPSRGGFDEHKAMIGWDTAADAKDGYRDNYEKGWQGLGKITRLTVSQFKRWLADGDKTSPIAEQAFSLKEAADKEDGDEDSPVVLVIHRSFSVQIISPKSGEDDGEDEEDDEDTPAETEKESCVG